MDRRDPSMLPHLPRWRCLKSRLLVAGLPLLAAGCTDGSPVAEWFLRPSAIVAGAEIQQVRADVEQVSAEPEPLPLPRAAPTTIAPSTAPHISTPPHGEVEVMPRKLVPISLDTVLRLAEDNNLQIGQSRARVNQAEAEFDLAAKRWLPDLWLGNAYYRHEGGIQLEEGQNIHSSTGAMLSGLDIRGRVKLQEYAYTKVSAERKAWQNKAELSRLSADTVLDAANTYIDLLAAQSGKAIARTLEGDLVELLDRAKKLAATEPGARVEVSRIQAEIAGRRQNAAKFEGQAAAASAKLVYLLGLDPCSELLPIDAALVPFDLVDASQPTCDLVARALAGGPGVRELEAMVGLIEDAIKKSKGIARLLPEMEMRMTEGGFGAGPGDTLLWDNRWDLYLGFRWNLMEARTRKERQRIAEAQRMQAHLAYDDLRAKLTAGVQEARETILDGSQEIQQGETQVRYAGEARQLSKERLDNNVMGSTASEVLLSMQSLGMAQVNYLSAIRDYDKAQLRLLILTGCPTPLPPHGN